jgi:hypothetical protein
LHQLPYPHAIFRRGAHLVGVVAFFLQGIHFTRVDILCVPVNSDI